MNSLLNKTLYVLFLIMAVNIYQTISYTYGLRPFGWRYMSQTPMRLRQLYTYRYVNLLRFVYIVPSYVLNCVAFPIQ